MAGRVSVRGSLVKTLADLALQGQEATVVYMGSGWLRELLAPLPVEDVQRCTDFRFMGVPVVQLKDVDGYVVLGGRAMELARARLVAEEVVEGLRGACVEIEVAGSIRRQKAHPKDVEIVFVPKLATRAVSFFDEEEYPLTDDAVARLVEAGVLARDTEVRRWGPKYKRAIHVETGMVVEMFAAAPENWGYILALRTGPADFNKVLVSKGWAGGAMPLDMRVADGYLWHAGELVETPTEASFFEAIGVPCWPPEERTVGRLQAWMRKERRIKG